MFHDRTLERLDQMLDSAMKGHFQESDYDETKLSRLEGKWKRFLTSSQLSSEKLKEAKHNVESLVSDISHQTRTPIANMQLYVELLEERLQGKEELRLVEEIRRQTDKLEFLIQSLAKLSRLEGDMIALHPQMDSVDELLDEVLVSARHRAAQKGIMLVDSRAEGRGGRCTACFDRKWTKEVLDNILDNAVKYSPPGSQIVCSVTEYELYVSISIRDHGIGIAEQEQPKIFGRFYRSPKVAAQEGVGLGLYLAREVVRRENGYIQVHSREGEGAEFLVFLWRS